MITPDQIISLDPYLIAVVSKNVITIGFVLGIFKGIAKITKSVTDDKICTLFSNAIMALVPGKKLEDKPEKIEVKEPETGAAR
jgi:dimeric dUTPase (all-alpha-NTP-PPase superfamily)